MNASDTSYNALSTVAAIGSGILTRSLVQKAWTGTTGNEPPNDPADPSTGWTEAIAWAAAAGVAVGVGRVVARRLTAEVLDVGEGA